MRADEDLQVGDGWAWGSLRLPLLEAHNNEDEKLYAMSALCECIRYCFAERHVYSQGVELLELDEKYIQSGTEHDLTSGQIVE